MSLGDFLTCLLFYRNFRITLSSSRKGWGGFRFYWNCVKFVTYFGRRVFSCTSLSLGREGPRPRLVWPDRQEPALPQTCSILVLGPRTHGRTPAPSCWAGNTGSRSPSFSRLGPELLCCGTVAPVPGPRPLSSSPHPQSSAVWPPAWPGTELSLGGRSPLHLSRPEVPTKVL